MMESFVLFIISSFFIDISFISFIMFYFTRWFSRFAFYNSFAWNYRIYFTFIFWVSTWFLTFYWRSFAYFIIMKLRDFDSMIRVLCFWLLEWLIGCLICFFYHKIFRLYLKLVIAFAFTWLYSKVSQFCTVHFWQLRFPVIKSAQVVIFVV